MVVGLDYAEDSLEWVCDVAGVLLLHCEFGFFILLSLYINKFVIKVFYTNIYTNYIITNKFGPSGVTKYLIFPNLTYFILHSIPFQFNMLSNHIQIHNLRFTKVVFFL